MSKISTYAVVPVPKLADKLIGTSVGGEIEDVTYNFTLQELLDLYIPLMPANNLQGILDFGNTATQDINLFGTINTTYLNVTDTANFLNSYFTGETHIQGGLFDSAESIGEAGQVLTSTGEFVEWVTLPPIFTPDLQQVLDIGNTSNTGIILDATLQALNVETDTAVISTNITISGTITDEDDSVGTAGKVLSSTATGVKWVALPVYSATSPLLFNSATGVFSIQQSTNTQAGYLSAADWITFNGKQNAGNYITSLTGQATASGPGAASVTLNNAAVIGKVLTGFNTVAGTINASDSILTAFGKTQSQINALVGGIQYQGTWNASTNVPTLESSVGVQGHYYIVSVAGNTDLDGITDWQVGDWAIFSETTWQKVDNTESVVSVNGFTGAVSLTTDDIPEGTTNLYYLDSRARGALSFESGSGAYDNVTGVITIPTDNSEILNGAGYIVLGSLSASSPLSYNILTGAFSIQKADATHNGYLSSTDWSAFNSKLSSVGVSMPSAFSVANSPLIANGTIAITGAGNASQYIRGDGTLAAYNPGSGGGGSSQVFYFNGGVPSDVVGYKQMSTVANTGASADFSINADGYIASFLTDAGSPSQLNIPAGNWNFEIFFNASSSGGTPSFYVELYKYASSTFTLISSSSANPEGITNGTSVDLYTTALAVPATTLTVTDRLAVRVYVTHSGRTITMHTQDSNLSEVITTFSTGITALNGLTTQVQYFQVGSAGTDFNISSVTDIHTFNIPSASASNRGLLTSSNWTTFNNKIGGTGTANYLSKFTGVNTIGDSIIYNSGSVVAIGTTTIGFNAYGLPLVVGSGIGNQGITVYSGSASYGSLHFAYGITGGQSYNGGFEYSHSTNELTVLAAAGASAIFKYNQVIIPYNGAHSAGSESLYVQENARINGQLSLGSTLTNGTYTYTLPGATGTLALTSDLAGYVTLATTQTISGSKTFTARTDFDGSGGTQDAIVFVYNTLKNRLLTPLVRLYGATNITSNYVELFGVLATANRTVNFPDASGTVALTSDFSGYVPYTGATGAVNLGAYNLTVNGISVGKGAGTNIYNTAIGVGSLVANTSGDANTAVGYYSLQSNTTGVGNSALGTNALNANTTGPANTAIGNNALLLVTTGGYNIGIGINAGSAITTGNNNTIIGNYSGTAGLYGNIVLADGVGNIKFQWDGTNILLNGNVNLSGYNITAGGTSSFVAATLTSNLWLQNSGTYDFIISYATSLTTNTVRAYYTNTNELRFYGRNTAGVAVVPKIMVGDGTTFTQLGTGTIGGTGTANYLSKFTAASTIANSGVYDNGTTVTFGTIANTSAYPTVVMQNRLGTVLSVAGFNWAGTTTDNNSVNSLMIIGGYLNTSAQTVATATTAAGMQFYNGGFYWYGNTSLTPGTVYTNTQRMFLTNQGNLILGASSSTTRQFEIYNADNAYMKFNGQLAGNHPFTIGNDAYGFVIYDETSSLYRLQISNSTGEATFSGNLQLGAIGAGTSTATPLTINLGSTYSSTAGSNLKLRLFESAGSVFGIGISDSQMDFNVPSGCTYRFYTGAAKFSGNVTIGADGVGGGGANFLKFNYEANTDSRSWRLMNDNTVFGDFAIQQSTTYSGSTYANRFYINLSGFVGIGTSTPSRLLHVSGASVPFKVSSSNNGFLFELDYAGTSTSYIGTSSNGLIFAPSSASIAMTITSAGDVGIGSSTITYATGNRKVLLINGGNNGALLALNVNDVSDFYLYSDGANTYMQRTSSVGNLFVTNYTSGVYLSNGGVAWIANSDERLKTNLKPIENAINKILKLRSVTGRYKTDDSSISRSFLIAQDVLSVLPEAVNLDEKSGMLGVAYTDVIPLLVASIKEQQKQIEELKKLIK